MPETIIGEISSERAWNNRGVMHGIDHRRLQDKRELPPELCGRVLYLVMETAEFVEEAADCEDWESLAENVATTSS